MEFAGKNPEFDLKVMPEETDIKMATYIINVTRKTFVLHIMWEVYIYIYYSRVAICNNEIT